MEANSFKLSGHNFGGMIGFKPFYKELKITFYRKSTDKGYKFFAHEDTTGANITYLWNWVGYDTIEEAIYDTTKVIMCYGGSDRDGFFYKYIKEMADNSFIRRNKSLNFISLKLNKIIK